MRRGCAIKTFQSTSIFNAEVVEGSTYEIHFLGIDIFTVEFEEYMKEHFVAICEGGVSESPFEMVKKRVAKFFHSKDENTKMGAVAEFIMHLYLKSLGYKQECTYFNLEEGSIKKGFDGYYSKDETEWILRLFYID